MSINKFSSLFPSYQEKNVTLYYLITMFTSGWFIIGTWFFYVLKYVTAYQMSVLESASFGLGLVFEIPSGAIADLLGKKITTQIGLGLLTLGMLLFSLANLTSWFLILGNILILVSWAFISGSLEALVYDTLIEKKKETKYDVIASKVSFISPAIYVVAAFIGGILWKYSIHLPNIFSFFSFLIAFLLSFFLKEPTVDTYVFSWKQFKQQNIDGFGQLFKDSMKRYLFIFIFVSAAYYMWGAGLVRIAMGKEFGYDGETLSYMIALVSLISSLVVFKFDSIKIAVGDKVGLLVIGTMAIIGWFLAGVGGRYVVGLTTFLLLTVSGQLLSPWMSSVINKKVPSKLRATTISTMQFFVQIPYVLVVIWFGSLIESGKTSLFYYLITVLLLLATVTSFVLFQKHD